MSRRGETSEEELDRERYEFALGETRGEMGYIDGGLPDRCPGCGGAREDLMYWTEDRESGRPPERRSGPVSRHASRPADRE